MGKCVGMWGRVGVGVEKCVGKSEGRCGKVCWSVGK